MERIVLLAGISIISSAVLLLLEVILGEPGVAWEGVDTEDELEDLDEVEDEDEEDDELESLSESECLSVWGGMLPVCVSVWLWSMSVSLSVCVSVCLCINFWSSFIWISFEAVEGIKLLLLLLPVLPPAGKIEFEVVALSDWASSACFAGGRFGS